MSIRALIISEDDARGVFINRESVKDYEKRREDIVKEIIGKTYLRLDGIGGCTPHSNNVVFIWVEDDIVEYEVAKVVNGKVYWDEYDGNLTASVGVFAIKEGLIKTNQLVVKHKQSGISTLLKFEGERVIETWTESIEKVLITKKPIDDILVRGRYVRVSIVNSLKPIVIVRARDLEMEGYEMPDEELGEIEKLFDDMVLKLKKIIGNREPIIVTIANPRDYLTLDRREIRSIEFDLSVREYNLRRFNETLSIASGIGLGFSSLIPNSLTNFLARPVKYLRLAHPLGVMKFEVNSKENYLEVSVERNVKIVMEGNIFI
ncbi:MAG: PrpF domain-containing protein [Sulfolobaceae archaeon]